MTANTDDDASFLWHHSLHEHIAGESLFFVLIRATPYRQQRLITSVVDTCIEFNVRSYAVWEMFGEYDALIRLWLPHGRSIVKYQKSLSGRVGNGAYFNAVRFQVDTFECHTDLDTDIVVENASRILDPRDLSVPTNTVPPVRAKKYRTEGLASPTSMGHKKGKAKTLKLFTWVRTSEEARTEESDSEAVSKIRDVLTESKSITSASLFTGVGEKGAYLIGSRLLCSDFEIFSQETAPSIQQAVGQYTAKTVTFVASRSHPLIRREVLQPGMDSSRLFQEPPPSASDVRRLLGDGESAMLEIKGSAFRDIGRFVKSGNRGGQEAYIVHEIIKSVAAFLNSQGGTLLIGALESTAFSLEEVRSRLSDAIEIGDFILVDAKYDQGGKVDWDRYEMKLRQTIASSITIAPEHYLRFSRVNLSGVALVCVEVASGDRNFWVKNKSSGREEFYVRRGNRTEELSGSDLEAELDRRKSR